LQKDEKDTKIQVCMVTFRFYPDYSGGGRQALSLSKVLKKNCVNIMVLTLDLNKSVWCHPNLVEYIENLPVHRIPAMIKFRFELLVRYCRFIFVGIKKWKSYSIIHAHGLLEGYVGWIIGRLSGKPVIIKLGGISEIVSSWYSVEGVYNWENNETTLRKSWRPDKIFYRWLIKHFDGVICTTEKLKSICITAGVPKKNIYCIPNGVNTEKFHVVSHNEKQAVRSLLGLDTDDFILGTALTLRPTKGLDLLLEACCKIPSDIKMQLLIVGLSSKDVYTSTSVFSKRVVRHLNQLPQNVKIMFAGFVPDIQQYLFTIDGFVLPSRSEGFPNSALESMSCGLPCIFSKISWTKGIIEHEL